MKTNELISLLAEDAPVRLNHGRLLTTALAIGIVISATLLLATIGMRPNMAAALETIRVLFKVLVTFALALTACNLVFRIGRPGVPLSRPTALLLVPLLALIAATIIEMIVVPEGEWHARMMGQHALFCVFFIPVLSLAPLAGFTIALRNGAPENPRLAGAVAGLASGGIAAAIYAWHCPDDSPMFVATWYSLAVALVSAGGSLIGGRLLRW